MLDRCSRAVQSRVDRWSSMDDSIHVREGGMRKISHCRPVGNNLLWTGVELTNPSAESAHKQPFNSKGSRENSRIGLRHRPIDPSGTRWADGDS